MTDFQCRHSELRTLDQWITREHCRLVALLGTGGIGKTAFSVKLAEHLQGHFEYLIWRSLLQAPLLDELLSQVIQFLSNSYEVKLPLSLEDKIGRLMEYLRSHRCLLVLDNFESILLGGVSCCYREGYEGYSLLLQRLGEVRHQSCVVLTSRAKPQEVTLLEGETSPVRSFSLRSSDFV